MKLDSRKLKILQAIIDDYITTAEPVGSRSIVKKHNLGISSATVRNEMSDLEDMGYLEQPYTSAGRIPSDKAYRLYVDELMQIKKLGSHKAEKLKKIYANRLVQVEDVIFRTAKVLSDITNYTSMVLSPQLSKVIIKHIQLLSVDKNFALLVVVTNSGIIKDTLISIPHGLDKSSLEKISNILNEQFGGTSFDQVDVNVLSDVRERFINDKIFFDLLVDKITEQFADVEPGELYLEGASNMFNYPEFQDILNVKSFLSILENKDLLLKTLKNSAGDLGVTVSIGTENPYEELKDCSIVSATYKVGNVVLGSIGVIGPTRMEYSKAISAMGFMAHSLSQYLTMLYGK